MRKERAERMCLVIQEEAGRARRAVAKRGKVGRGRRLEKAAFTKTKNKNQNR